MRKQTVLIIDDDPIILGVLTRILVPAYDVKAARSGEAGIELVNKHQIDLILLDIVMQGMSGFETLEALKQNESSKHIPILFLTGNDSNESERMALAMGAADYIRKPFLEDIVLLRVGNQLKLVEQMQIIERFSFTDGLTGINNRRFYDKQLSSEWTRAGRHQHALSLFMVDIDFFKTFNDEHGHLNGDIALKTAATVLVSTVHRGTDYVFRWGGEEFAVLLPGTPIDGAMVVAERIRRNIENTPIQLADKTVQITVSIGVTTTVPPQGCFPEGMQRFCETADEALYKAKELGRNRVVRM